MLKKMYIIGGLLILITGCQQQGMQDLGGMPSPNLTDADNNWFKTMAITNQFEIQSSQLALQKSQNAGVREFAQHMIDDHTRAETELASLASGKQLSLPNQLDAKHKTIMGDLQVKSGPDFDKEYINVEVTGHEEAISANQNEADNGTDQQVRMQANNLVDTLKSHLAMARKLHNELQSAGM